jgi:hypothetical protein
MKRTRPDLKKKSKAAEMHVLSVKDFYKKFKSEKRRYHPSLFCTDKPTKLIREKEVPEKLFKKIILEYLKMYFFQFYNEQKSIYFPLGGFMKKVRYPKWNAWMPKGKGKKQLSKNEAIGLFWYQRASKKMQYMVCLRKLTGSSNRIPKIEEFYKNNFNIDLLPIFNTEMKRQFKNKTLYLCSLT